MVISFLRQNLKNQENQKLDAVHDEKLVDNRSLRIRDDNISKVRATQNEDIDGKVIEEGRVGICICMVSCELVFGIFHTCCLDIERRSVHKELTDYEFDDQPHP